METNTSGFVQPAPHLDRVQSRLLNSIEGVMRATDDLNGLYIRLYGPFPESDHGPEALPGTGAMNTLDYRLDKLEQVITELSAAVARNVNIA